MLAPDPDCTELLSFGVGFEADSNNVLSRMYHLRSINIKILSIGQRVVNFHILSSRIFKFEIKYGYFANLSA